MKYKFSINGLLVADTERLSIEYRLPNMWVAPGETLRLPKGKKWKDVLKIQEYSTTLHNMTVRSSKDMSVLLEELSPKHNGLKYFDAQIEDDNGNYTKYHKCFLESFSITGGDSIKYLSFIPGYWMWVGERFVDQENLDAVRRQLEAMG